MTDRPDPVTHHREPVDSFAVRLDPDHADDAPGHGDFEITAVITSAIYGDGTAPATPTVDLRCPSWGLDDRGCVPLSVEQAVNLASALLDAARTARERAQR